MDWLEIVRQRMKRGNQILFSPGDTLLQELAQLLEQQNRRTVVLWALALAEAAVGELRVCYPEETRPYEALAAAREWACGERKMPGAKRAILCCHAMAKELCEPKGIALCHAVGQACSTVHTQRHAMGFPIYDLTAIVRDCGVDHCREAVEQRKQEYIERLTAWQHIERVGGGKWADFLQV